MEINKLLERKFFMKKKIMDGEFEGSFTGYVELPLHTIGNHLRRENKDIGFWFNQLKPGLKSHKIDNFMIPTVSWIDIDFKREDQRNDFKKDIKDPKKFMKDLEEDECVFIVGRTLGGGIRIVGLVDSYYREYEESVLVSGDDDEEWLDKQNQIFQVNNIIFQNYIKEKYGLREGTYLDKCADRISQPTFPLKKFHIKYDCNNLYHTTDISALIHPEIERTPQQILITANNNSIMIQDLYIQAVDLSDLFLTHDPSLITIVRFSSQMARKVWFNMYKRWYKGKSFTKFLYSFDTFERYLDNAKSLNNPQNLKWFLKNKGYNI